MKTRSFVRVAPLIVGGSLAGLVLLATSAGTQTGTQALSVVNRINSAYRSFRSYYDVSKITKIAGKKETTGTLTLAMQKPNRYLLELKGESLNTTILSNGDTLVALRPDRKAYTKTKAPQQVIGSDMIGNVDIPSPGAKIISLFLAANGREGELGKMLQNAKIAGPQAFGTKQAYVLSFPYTGDTEVKFYVTSDDYVIRQVKMLKNETVIWTEDHSDIQIDKTVPADTFAKQLAEGATMVASLPPLSGSAEVADAGNGGDSTDASSKAAAQPAAALALFRSNGCGRCHNGGTGPDLSHEGSDPEHTAKWIADHIRNPQSHTPGSRMPAYGSRMSDANIRTLAEYLAGLK
jgi:outer membrane lipoprotein-sorting protein